jgi:site-specific recombinase XerD
VRSQVDRPLILEPGALAAGLDASRPAPAIVAATGDGAARRFLEFFVVTIENASTREAYYRACWRFFAWCDARGLRELVDIEAMHVAACIKSMGGGFEKPSVKQHLAAIRILFDWLVVGQVIATNSAHSVRGPKHVVKRGKTPVLTADQVLQLAIDKGSTG